MTKWFPLKVTAKIAIVVLAIVLVYSISVKNASIKVPSQTQNMLLHSPVSETELSSAVTFLKEVMDVNLTRYIVTPFYSWPNHDNVSRSVDLILNSSETGQQEVRVGLDIRDGAVTNCFLHPDIGVQVIFSHDTTNIKDQAIGFLDRYLSYSRGATYIQILRDVIEEHGIKGPDRAVGNTTLYYVTTGGDYLSFYYVRAPQGIANNLDAVLIVFRDGVLTAFNDHWNSAPIGSYEVNINETEAIQIAKQAPKSSYPFSSRVNEKDIDLTMQVRDGLLYPLYDITLRLANRSSRYEVCIWADTREVALVKYWGI